MKQLAFTAVAVVALAGFAGPSLADETPTTTPTVRTATLHVTGMT